MEIYCVKLYTNNKDSQNYCIDKNRLAIGWKDKKANDRNNYIQNFNNDKTINKQSGKYQSIKNIISMEKNDYVWTKIDGRTFLLGLVKSYVRLNQESEVINNDNLDIGLERECEWRKIDFDYVPGQILSHFVGIAKTLTKVNCSEELKEYCQWLYNDKPEGEIRINDYKFLLHSDDLEDLLGLYLQQGIKDEKDEEYFIIPSTNKTSTKLIEYELRRKKDGKKACVQCKIGNDKVGKEIFTEFADYHRIFIATCSDVDYNNKSNNVKTIKIADLWNCAKNNYQILPKRIQNYVDITK